MQKFDLDPLMELIFRNSGAKFIDRWCKEHNKQWIMFTDGRANCPRCYCKKGNQTFQTDLNDEIQNEKKANITKHLEKYSVIPNQKILNSTLENYKAVCDETNLAKEKATNCAKLYLSGNNFNMVINGNSGAGKSHLAYAIAKEVSKKRRCLFISIPKMIDLIRKSFTDPEIKQNMIYFEKHMEEADILIIDDLGAEVGQISTDKTATDFVSSLLFNIYESRQGRSTITTSNLFGVKMKDIYDSRMLSRLRADTEPETIIQFHKATDKR